MPTRHPVALIALLCAAFVAVGGGVATLGPSLPGLAVVVGRPLPDLGALLSALFAGMLVGQAIAGLLVDRYGVRPTLLASFATYATGIIAIPFATAFVPLLGAGLVMGFGFGLASISVNSLAARLVPTRPGFVLNLANVWYACGSVAGPLLVSVVLARGGRAADVLHVAGALLVVLVPAAWWLVPQTPAEQSRGDAAGAVPRPPWRPSPALLVIGILVLLYAGVEAGFGGWVASYVQQTLGVSAARGALLTSLFWLSYLVGRMVATVATLAFRPGYVLAATVALIIVGGVVLGAGHGRESLTVAGIALLGAGVGPLYPAMFALVTSRFTERPATAVAVTSAVGSIGAVTLPWVMGRLLPLADGLVVAWLPAIYGVGMLAALLVSERLYRRERARRLGDGVDHAAG